MSSWTNLSTAASVAIGTIVGLLSTCVQSFGLTLQRKSHMLEDEKQDYEPRIPAYRRRRWQIGMFLFLIANIVGSTIQITTLPLPLLSTLQASGLVFNSLLASLLLKEPWTWRTVWGTLLVAAGAILISLFSALPEPSHSLQQLLNLLKMRGFLVWFILSLFFVFGVLAMDFTMRKIIPARQRGRPRLLLIRGMSYGAISGVLSAHALLLAKSAVELIVRSVTDKNNQFDNYRSWLLVLAFLVLALSQLYYLHLGLRLISTSILYPFVFCVYNIVAILDGLIYFQQMDRLPPLHAGLIALGTVILLAGVLALSWRLQEENEDVEQPRLSKLEIPQTVLSPGMGFVGDPDSDENESALADNDDEDDGQAEVEEGEERPLLSHRSDRSRTLRSTKSVSPYASRKRKRAATLREVMDIWDELGDNDEHYGTIRAGRTTSRPSSASQSRPSRRDSLPIRSETETRPPLQTRLSRASTMPANARQSTSGRRKSSHHAHGNALFSDMFQWWRPRRRSESQRHENGDSHEGRNEEEG